MARALWILSAASYTLTGCTGSAVDVTGLTFLERAVAPVPVENLISEKTDDGFGSAVVTAMGKVWIGAPHGAEGTVYVWSGAEVTAQIKGAGRMGSHLAGSSEAAWISAPLSEQVFNQDGEVVSEGLPGTGIALSDVGHVAWAEGWTASDGTTGSTMSRPSAVHVRDNALGVGMAHGDTAFSADTLSWPRPVQNDEAGFSVSSGLMSGAEVWLVGAPASGHVYALDANTLETLASWSGSGRFGHALAVTDIDGDQKDDLIVGAPFDGETGSVSIFYDFGDEGRPVDTAGCTGAGTSLHASDGRLLIGAPGDKTTKGQVLMVALGG